MKELVDYLYSEIGISDRVILEKDIILHRLLCHISNNNYFMKTFVFKGGTCLIKCYYGYYRFSEDLDFTWADQQIFEGKSQKEIRKLLSKEINRLALIIELFANKNNFDFKGTKSDKRYIELGGSNKFATFKIWYKSEILNLEQFIKIQINFMDVFKYPFKMREAKSILDKISPVEFEFLFPEESKQLLTNPKIRCYDINEI